MRVAAGLGARPDPFACSQRDACPIEPLFSAAAKALNGPWLPRASWLGTFAAMSDLAEVALPVAIDAEVDDSGLAAFYRGMTVVERRTMLACALGYALDGLDFTIYTLVFGTVIAIWNVDRGPAGLTVSATLICSAFGGWIAGYVSDRAGRVRARTDHRALVRALQSSLGVRAELHAARFLPRAPWIRLRRRVDRGRRADERDDSSALSRARRRVRAIRVGDRVGKRGACFRRSYTRCVPAQQAWRWMFALGFVPALYVLFVRRFVEEPPLAAAATNGADGLDLGDLLAGPPQDDRARRASRRGGSRRLLRREHLVAGVPPDRATPHHRGLDELSRVPDRGRVRGLSHRRLARRPRRPPQSLSALLGRRGRR